MDKHKRKRLIAAISNASGIAEYALEAKIDDDDLLEIFKNLELLKTLKPANTYNRYKQGQRTGEANQKLKETQAKLQQFLDIENSEILSAGKWLLHAIRLKGDERKQELLEKNLVHKDDYNEMNLVMGETIEKLDRGNLIAQEKSIQNNFSSSEKIDNLLFQLSQIKKHIIDKHGIEEWQKIESKIIHNKQGYENN
jgi:hypothetical protein